MVSNDTGIVADARQPSSPKRDAQTYLLDKSKRMPVFRDSRIKPVVDS